MYLSKARKWFYDIEPVVYAVSEFTYNGKPQLVPFLVGPSLLSKSGGAEQYAAGMQFLDVNVTGTQPYRGGGLTLSVILLESKSDNLLKPLLKVVEATAKSLDLSPAASAYTRIANLLMDGFDSLFNAGALTPVAANYSTYGPKAGQPFRPGYFALIDKPGVSEKDLWIRKNRLFQGPSLEAAKPYRDADYVLFGITGVPDDKRDDYELLPFNELWTSVKRDAASPKDEPDFAAAKRQMFALYQSVILSPDLTEKQADELADYYFQRMHAVHKRAMDAGLLAGEDLPNDVAARLDRARRKIVSLSAELT